MGQWQSKRRVVVTLDRVVKCVVGWVVVGGDGVRFASVPCKMRMNGGRKGDREKRQDIIATRNERATLGWHVPMPVTRRGIE
jgi:hypothetical protein